MSLFENELFDVVKLDIEGEELRRLRTVFDKLPNEDEYKDVYNPHMTLAYVKSGLGKKLQKTTNAKNQIPISTIKYSDKGDPMIFRL